MFDDNVVKGGLFTSASAGLRQYVTRVAGTRERKPSSRAGIFKSCAEGHKRGFAVSKTVNTMSSSTRTLACKKEKGRKVKGVVQSEAEMGDAWFCMAETRFVEGQLQL